MNVDEVVVKLDFVEDTLRTLIFSDAAILQIRFGAPFRLGHADPGVKPPVFILYEADLHLGNLSLVLKVESFDLAVGFNLDLLGPSFALMSTSSRMVCAIKKSALG